jgi:uncharacterized damage-inducible protein DinB
VNLLVEFYRYNTWATLQVIDFCSQQPLEVLEKNVVATDRSILHTLTHMAGSEQDYLQQITGEKILRPIAAGEILSLPELRRFVEQLAPYGQRAFERLDQIDMTIPAEDDWPETPHGQNALVLQLIQHGIDHRTQIYSTLGALGLSLPRIDGWRYWLAVHLSA